MTARVAILTLAVFAHAPAETILLERPHATVSFEGGFTQAEAEAFANLVEKGIVDICRFLDIAFNPSRFPGGRIPYRVSPDVRIAYAQGNRISLPARRVKDHSAPYLHETTHVLAGGSTHALWLSEGFASYVESAVADHYGGYNGHIFTKSGNDGIDAEARRFLEKSNGTEILGFIGASGRPRGLYWNRRGVAAPLYVMAQSFVKYLVADLGIAKLKKLLEFEDPSRAFLVLTGASVSAWKRAWMAKITPGYDFEP